MSNQTNATSGNIVFLKPMMEKIIIAACKHFGCTEDDLLEKSTVSDIVYRRSVCYYLITHNVIISPARIGKRFDRGRTTVIRQVDDIDLRQKIYAHIRHDLAAIMNIANNLDIQFTTHGMDAK
jgi:chromosomal replication initiation ATPase DnaA